MNNVLRLPVLPVILIKAFYYQKKMLLCLFNLRKLSTVHQSWADEHLLPVSQQVWDPPSCRPYAWPAERPLGRGWRSLRCGPGNG